MFKMLLSCSIRCFRQYFFIAKKANEICFACHMDTKLLFNLWCHEGNWNGMWQAFNADLNNVVLLLQTRSAYSFTFRVKFTFILFIFRSRMWCIETERLTSVPSGGNTRRVHCLPCNLRRVYCSDYEIINVLSKPHFNRRGHFYFDSEYIWNFYCLKMLLLSAF